MIEALQDWNPWWKKNENTVPNNLLGIKRDILDKIKPFLSLNRVITLIGIRRAGKSTILYQIISHLLQNEHISPEEILLINFEDIRFESLSIAEWYQLYLEELRPEKITYLFFDEIHLCKNWINFVRSHIDRKSARVFLTDSSTYLLAPELATILTGRKVTFEVYPLSFKEYLKFKAITLNGFGSKESAKLRGHLKDYINIGGFPEFVNLDWDTSKKLLLELFDDIISKDVVARFNVDYTKIRDFSYYILSNSAQKMSFRKLQSIFNLGSNVPQKYLEHLENVFFCFILNVYSQKVKEQVISPKKLYPVDTGLVNAVSFKVSENAGPLLELLVFIELKRRGHQIFYGNFDNKNEIDFVIKAGDVIQTVINVSYDLKEGKTRKREIEGLKFAIQQLNPKAILLITWQEEELLEYHDRQISIIPAWKWLLQEDKND